MDHGRRGSRELLYVVGIIIGIRGKEYGLMSEIHRVCRVCESESKGIVGTKIQHQGFGFCFIFLFY